MGGAVVAESRSRDRGEEPDHCSAFLLDDDLKAKLGVVSATNDVTSKSCMDGIATVGQLHDHSPHCADSTP